MHNVYDIWIYFEENVYLKISFSWGLPIASTGKAITMFGQVNIKSYDVYLKGWISIANTTTNICKGQTTLTPKSILSMICSSLLLAKHHMPLNTIDCTLWYWVPLGVSDWWLGELCAQWCKVKNRSTYKWTTTWISGRYFLLLWARLYF